MLLDEVARTSADVAGTSARLGKVERLAELLRRLRPDEVPVAVALMGAQRELVAQTRASVVAGLRGPALVRRVKAQGARAFDRLEAGLGDYGVKT